MTASERDDGAPPGVARAAGGLRRLRLDGIASVTVEHLRELLRVQRPRLVGV